MTIDNLSRYRPAILGGQYIQQENETAAKIVLSKLEKTLMVGEDGPELLEAIKKSPEGNKILASIYSEKHQNILGKTKVGDLFDFYSDSFKFYLDENSYQVAESYFKGIDETYGDVKNKVIRAQKNLTDNEIKLSDEEKQEAESTIKKYEKTVKYIESFESNKLKELGTPIEEEAFKKGILEDFKPSE